MFCFCIFIRILLYHRHTQSGMNILYFSIRPSGSYLLVFHPAGNYSRIYNKCLPEYWSFFFLEFRPSVRKCSLRWYSFRGHQSIVPVCSSPDYNLVDTCRVSLYVYPFGEWHQCLRIFSLSSQHRASCRHHINNQNVFFHSIRY